VCGYTCLPQQQRVEQVHQDKVLPLQDIATIMTMESGK
jgi:hypothetical protein